MSVQLQASFYTILWLKMDKYVFVEFKDGTLCEVKDNHIEIFCSQIVRWLRNNSGNPFGAPWGFPPGFSERDIRIWWIETW